LFLDALKNHLVAKGITWPIYTGYLPPTPDQVIALFETPGDDADIVSDSSEISYDKSGFQVRVRGARLDYESVRDQIHLCFVALHANEPATTSGEPVFVYVYAVGSGPLPMGLDGNERHELSWNFRTMRSREEA